MITEMILASVLSTSEIVIKDLGRLTPFGHTFDVYIKNDHGLIPRWAGAREAGTSVAWRIDGPVWKNHNDSALSYWFNIPELVEYYENSIPNGWPDWEPGQWWECHQANPYQWYEWQNTSVPTFWSIPFGPQAGQAADWASTDSLRDTWWADSWIVMDTPWQLSGNSASTNPVAPRMHKFLGNLLSDNKFEFWAGYSIEPDSVACPYEQGGSFNGYPYYWNGKMIDFEFFSSNPSRTWESEEYPNHFRIARITGPDYFGFGAQIGYRIPLEGTFDEKAPAGQMIFDNSCPSDLDEDGQVGFSDLLQVLGDAAAGKYARPFEPILKVLSEYGPCGGGIG